MVREGKDMNNETLLDYYSNTIISTAGTLQVKILQYIYIEEKSLRDTAILLREFCNTSISHEWVNKHKKDIDEIIRNKIIESNYFDKLKEFLNKKNFIQHKEIEDFIENEYQIKYSKYPKIIALTLDTMGYKKISVEKECIWFSKKINISSRDFKNILSDILSFFQKRFYPMTGENIYLKIRSVRELKGADCLELLDTLNFVYVTEGQYIINPKYYASPKDIIKRMLIDEPTKTMSVTDIAIKLGSEYNKPIGEESVRNILNTLKPEVRPIGKSSKYTINDSRCTESVVKLIKGCLQEKGTPLTIDEIYESISNKRTEITKNSIQSFISSNRDAFLSLSDKKIILAQWYRNYMPQVEEKRGRAISKIIDQQIIEYLNLNREANAEELYKYVDYESKIDSFKVYLNKKVYLDKRTYSNKTKRNSIMYSLKVNYIELLNLQLKQSNKDVDLIIKKLEENNGEMLQKDLSKKLKQVISPQRINYLIKDNTYFEIKTISVGKRKYNRIILKEKENIFKSPIFNELEIGLIKSIYNAILKVETNPTIYENMSEPQLSDIIASIASEGLMYYGADLRREEPGGYAKVKNGEIDFFAVTNKNGVFIPFGIGENKFLGNKTYEEQILQNLGYCNQYINLAFNILVIKDTNKSKYAEAISKRDKIVEEFKYEDNEEEHYKTLSYSAINKLEDFKELNKVMISLHERKEIGDKIKYVHFVLHLKRVISKGMAQSARNV